MFEELCRAESWGQHPEPICFQSQFYSLPCTIQTQCFHLKMGTITPTHTLPHGIWEDSRVRQVNFGTQEVLAIVLLLLPLLRFTQRFPKVSESWPAREG